MNESTIGNIDVASLLSLYKFLCMVINQCACPMYLCMYVVDAQIANNVPIFS